MYFYTITHMYMKNQFWYSTAGRHSSDGKNDSKHPCIDEHWVLVLKHYQIYHSQAIMFSQNIGDHIYRRKSANGLHLNSPTIKLKDSAVSSFRKQAVNMQNVPANARMWPIRLQSFVYVVKPPVIISGAWGELTQEC